MYVFTFGGLIKVLEKVCTRIVLLHILAAKNSPQRLILVFASAFAKSNQKDIRSREMEQKIDSFKSI